VERIERSILALRGMRVMLDEALARLCGVEVRVLNQAVSRNIERFPGDFMFQLTANEAGTSKITNCDLRSWAWTAPEVHALRLH
jgi:hypothetical protein